MIIEIDGMLGKEFGDQETHFHEAKDILKELCSKLRGFKETVITLSEKGMDYILVKDKGKYKILPILCGAKSFWSKFFTILGVVALAVSVAGIIADTAILGVTSGTWGLIGASLLTIGSLLAKPSAQSVDTSSPTSAGSASTNLGGENPDANGTPIPIGYGKCLVSPVSIFQCLDSIRGNADITSHLNLSGR
jgi:predicted phage tail protein